MSLFEDASLIITPNGRKTGKIYALKPFNGSGDLTVVRATTATEVNSSGVIVDVASNVARFDYTNGSCPSILVEPQRTNLVLRSEEFDNLSWIKTASTVTANATTSPRGTITADKLMEISGGNIPRLLYLFTATIGQNYTLSFYLKSAERNQVRVVFEGNGTKSAFFNSNTGVVSGIGVNTVASMTLLSNGFYRCNITILAGASSSSFYIATAENNSSISSGDNTKGIYIWGAQLEAGANATSYIPTVASAVTRNADVISKTGISDLIGQTEGTMYVEIKAISDDNVEKHITISDGTNVNRIDLFYGFYGAGKVYYEVRAANSVQGGLLNGNLSVESMNKIAVVYKTNRFELWINGTKVAQDLIGNTFSGSTLSTLQTSLPNGTMRYFGSINLIALFKTALTDTQLSQLTTP